jgi:hypothetical protein
MSQDIITPDNQMEQDKNKLYTPAKSLNPTEMAVSGKKLDYLFEKRKKLDEHYRVYIPKMRDDAEGTLKEEASYFSRNKRPRLGFFGTIGNWFSKTFQKRPSKAYEAYTERKKEYEKHVAKRATMNRRLKALDAAEKREAKHRAVRLCDGQPSGGLHAFRFAESPDGTGPVKTGAQQSGSGFGRKGFTPSGHKLRILHPMQIKRRA